MLTPCCLLSQRILLLSHHIFFTVRPGYEKCVLVPGLISIVLCILLTIQRWRKKYVSIIFCHFTSISLPFSFSVMKKNLLLFYRNKLVTEYIKSQLNFVHVRDDSQIYNTGTNCLWTTWWNNTLFLNVLLIRLRKTPWGKWWWFTWKVEQTHSRLTVTTAVKKLTQSNRK